MSGLIEQLEGVARLHDRKLTALRLAQTQPETGRMYIAEWMGLRDAEQGFPRCYWADPQTQAYYDRGFVDGQTILYVHGARQTPPCVAA
jgi:hypothetical protein